MSASALLSLLTGVAPQGASPSSAPDGSSLEASAFADVFHAMLDISGGAGAGAEVALVTEQSPVIAATPDVNIVPALGGLVLDLPLTEDAAQSLLESEEEPAEKIEADADIAAPSVALVFAPAPEVVAAPSQIVAPAANDAAEPAAFGSAQRFAPQPQSQNLPSAQEPIETASPEVQAEAAEQPQPAARTEVSTHAAEKSPTVASSLASMNAALEKLTKSQASTAEPDVKDARPNAPTAEQVIKPALMQVSTNAAAHTGLAQTQLAAVRPYSADGRIEATDDNGNAATASDIGNALSPDADTENGLLKTANADAAPEVSKSTARPSSEIAAASLLSTEAEAETAEVDLQRPQITENAPARAEAQGTRLSLATIQTTAEIAARIIDRLGQRTTRFDMVLTPETLGNVEVSLEVGADGQMQARLAFENPQAANALRDRAEELRRQLIESGFSVAENALEFTDRENDQRGGFNEFMSDSRSNRRAFAGAVNLAAEADIPVAPVWTPVNLSPSGVDMKV